jgi:tagatose 1,6-diphosphate aldolase
MSDPKLPVGYETRTRSELSVTRLFGLGLTPGKLRGLQRISNDNGTLTMVATDQNSAMMGLIQEARDEKNKHVPVSYDEMVEAKCRLARAMAPHASGILIDAYYGALSAMASGSIPAHKGMLIRIERSGAKFDKGPAKDLAKADYELGLSVAKVKMMGADAVKLLAPFEPTQHDSAEHQMAFVQEIYEQCRRHDILMVLEPVAIEFIKRYEDDPNKKDKDGKPVKKAIKESKKAKDKDDYVVRKAETVIETARYLSRYCDVYKAEFPGTFGVETDSQLAENLKKLDSACERPWVLLSAGVEFAEYKKQVEMAMSAGATGVLGGRAFWKEYFLQKDDAAKDKYLKDVCGDRVRQVNEIVLSKATPWFVRYGITAEQLRSVRAAEGWHVRYAGSFGGGAASVLGDGAY